MLNMTLNVEITKDLKSIQNLKSIFESIQDLKSIQKYCYRSKEDRSKDIT